MRALRIARCRYVDTDNKACTSEVVDPDAQLRLCSRHLSWAYELLRDRLGRVLAESTKGN
jgi:hypothetical protein